MERLQRVLAERGVASRRKAEELIRAGRVTVDGRVITELGTKVDPERAEIRVNGKLIRPQPKRYILLNKPSGYITTTKDERNRRTVMDIVQVPERVYPVGRLDRDTSGLLLLTNDGELANRIMHPRYGLEKEYHVLTPVRP
ncbi:MAG: rRNA pseudouridine synthase, partial [Chloroflexota bacterium]